MKELETKVWDKLKTVVDPETNLNVVDMGLITDLTTSDEGTVSAVFKPSSPVCPLAYVLAIDIKRALEEIDGVNNVDLVVVDFVGAERLNKMLSGEDE